MLRSQDRPNGLDSEFSTSPMADIAFLLVVFFMVTMTFSVTRGLDFAVPESPEGPVEPQEAVLVEIAHGGGLTVDGRIMASGDLLAYLEPKLRRNPTKPVILRPAPDAAYGDMVGVYDLLRRGREELALAEEIQIAVPTSREVEALWQ